MLCFYYNRSAMESKVSIKRLGSFIKRCTISEQEFTAFVMRTLASGRGGEEGRIG